MATVYRRGDVWWVRFRMGGAHIRRSAKTSKKSEAQALLAKLMEEHAQAARGEVLPRHLLTEAIERFFEEVRLKTGTIETYRYNARTLTRILGPLHLDEIDRRVIAEFVTIRKRTEVADATIRRDLAFLGSVFTMAERWGWVVTSPVTKAVKKALKESRPRTRYLTRDEFVRLHDAASASLKPILVLAVETGLRKEELLSLTMTSIDLRRRELHLEVTKSGRPRLVPLSRAALVVIREMLEQRSRPRSPYLLCRSDGRRVGDPRKAFEGACERAKIKDFRWHDLRHTFASWWVQDGGDLYRLSRILGHATLQMTARYGHLRTDDLHEEIERVAQKRTRDRQTAATEPVGDSDEPYRYG
ncbi:Site-specific recombinase XerD [Methylobacterium gossipiicola]|uniref:Site-specific recombinase XerD n=2 Tax=Methylobacterium gossipiicola TaxID=582675 RepID=A0A1I2WKL9_9HYPH|nr:Site-specific recombinase XerD [Methylobacterium gossipiicola]